MPQDQNRENHMEYAALQANRDVLRIFMWLKLAAAVGSAGFIVWFLLTNTEPGSGVIVYFAIVPLFFLLSAGRNWLTIRVSHRAERIYRRNDLMGMSNAPVRLVVLLFGYLILHALMHRTFGEGYLSAAFAALRSGETLVPFAIFVPYIALTGFVIREFFARTDEPAELPEPEVIAKAQATRRAIRWKILAIYAATAVGAVGIIYFGAS